MSSKLKDALDRVIGNVDGCLKGVFGGSSGVFSAKFRMFLVRDLTAMSRTTHGATYELRAYAVVFHTS